MKRNPSKAGAGRRAITLLELLVVVLIIGILSTIATNVYTGQTLRARNAATRNTIRELMVAAVRYEIDTGELPISGSGTIRPNIGSIPQILTRTPDTGITSLTGRGGCGFLYLELVHSLSGFTGNPYPSTWAGPYLEFPAEVLKGVSDTGVQLVPGQIQILDAFGEPFEYISSLEYQVGLTRHFDIPITVSPFALRGTVLFNGNKPQTAQLELPPINPFFATETFYNPRTFQIYSTGYNETTFDGSSPPTDDPGIEYSGTEKDDINNFGY